MLKMVGWLVFNCIFSTNRLLHAIADQMLFKGREQTDNNRNK